MQFPNHKPEDADLSNIPGYTGHPGQERVHTVYSDEQAEELELLAKKLFAVEAKEDEKQDSKDKRKSKK